MEQKKALQIIKAAIDLGISKGNFVSMDQVYALIESWNVIAQHFESKKDESNNAAD